MSRSNRRGYQKRVKTRPGGPQRPRRGRSGTKDPVVSNESDRVDETPVTEQETATDQVSEEDVEPSPATDQVPEDVEPSPATDEVPVEAEPQPMDEPPSLMPDWVIEQAREQGIQIGKRRRVVRRPAVVEPAVREEPAEVNRIAYGSPRDDGMLTRPGESDGKRSFAEVEAALERARAENAELRRRLAVLEALAEERADRIRDLRRFQRSPRGARKADREAQTVEPDLEPFVWSGEITLEDTTP